MTQVKPWMSFADQLSLLKSRGLLVNDETAALAYLERIGYYRLSGYWYSFRRLKTSKDNNGKLMYLRQDQFNDKCHFKDAVRLYVFDKKLRLLALDALERIELSVRVDIAHLLAQKDIYAHENPTLFHGHFSKQLTKGKNKGKTNHQLWLENFEQILFRARREPFVEHYKNKHGKLPIWVAIEIWDFGLMSKLYAGMKWNDQHVIASKYGASNGVAFAGWLRSLNFIRNVSAHHSRLWNINVLERAALLQDDKFWQKLNNARPFYYFCIMKKLMDIICPNSSWSNRLIELMKEFPKVDSKSVSLSDFGLIQDWKEWEFWT